MTAINHAVTGSIIAAYAHSPAIALPLALLSHFILDSLPHLGVGLHNKRLFNKILAADITLSTLFLVAIAVFQPAYWPLIIGCACLAMSPDLMWLPLYIRELRHQPEKRTNLIIRFHQKIQRYEFAKGYLVEITWLIVTLSFLTITLTRHWS
jgi:hypothetical protein